MFGLVKTIPLMLLSHVERKGENASCYHDREEIIDVHNENCIEFFVESEYFFDTRTF